MIRFARLLVLLPLLWVEGVWAVDCADTDYYLQTQVAIDDLGATGCDAVSGNVYISGFDFDLSPLSNIQSIGGNLTLEFVDNIDGLASLATIGGSLEIDRSKLTSLDGFDSLTNIGGGLALTSNLELIDVQGLEGIESLENLVVQENHQLTSLDGLSGLTTINGQLYLRWNRDLPNLDAFAGLTTVGEIFIIDMSLAHIDGLSNAAGYTTFWLERVNSIVNVDALVGVTELAALFITESHNLLNLDGLSNLVRVEPDGYLEVSNNGPLANCKGLAPLLAGEEGVDYPTSFDIRNASGCRGVEQILASVTPPTPAEITDARFSSGSIIVDFSLSTSTETAFPITGYSASCTGAEVDVGASPATALLDNTPVQESLSVSGYDPTSVLAAIEVDIDITHSDPTDLYITLTTPEGTELVLWNQGSSGGEDLVGSFPASLTAVDSLDSVARQTMHGEWVLSIEDIDVGPLVREGVLNSWGLRITEELSGNEPIVSESRGTIRLLGAMRGNDYSCTVAPITKLGAGPLSAPYTVSVPLTLPSAPTINSTDYEDGKIILTVSVSDNGGSDIIGYNASCSDGTNTFTKTSTSSRITVSGLTNGVAYTCRVTATNSIGPSSASAATAPIVPEETLSSGLPAWLLYAATQPQTVTAVDQSVGTSAAQVTGVRIDSSHSAGQTFTPAVSGELTSVRMYLRRGGASAAGVTVEIRAVSNGVPSGDVLATKTIANGDVAPVSSSVGAVTVTFATPAALTSGDVYAVLLQTSDAVGYDIWHNNVDYADGTALAADGGGTNWSDAGFDFSFETVMTYTR